MLPTRDETHVADGLNLLIGQYRGLTNIAEVLSAALSEVQTVEDATWDAIDAQLLANNPTGQALYNIADLVGCPRGTFTDAQLLFLVRVWIQARKSDGLSDDLIGICAKVFPDAYTYDEAFPASFQVWIPNVPDETLLEPLAQALTIARPPGVSGVVAWGTWPATTFFFGDDYSGLVGSGLGDDYSGNFMEGLLAATEV